jgi:GNAT superfamily N-acetyltransferase
MNVENLNIKQMATKKDLMEFIKFPWQIYKNDKNWIPPLIGERKDFFNKDKNPFFKHSEVVFYLAEKNENIVGRIAGILNHNHIEFQKEKAGFFGFFECVEDYEVAKILLDKVRSWLKSKGMEIMRGPANFSSNEEWGFLVEGFDSPPVFMMSYNPKHYLDFMERYGIRKAKDLYAYFIDKNSPPPQRVVKMAESIKQKENIKLHSVNMKDIKNEAEKIKTIYNSAWSKNWGFIPMTNEEFDHMVEGLKRVVDPDLVFIAEVDGEPAGFSLAVPDINQVLHKINGRLFPFGLFKLLWHTKIKNKINGVRIITMGVIPEFQKRGIDTVFYVETYNVGVKRGYTWAEMSWVLEDNVKMNRILDLLGAKLYKKYRVYEMGI